MPDFVLVSAGFDAHIDDPLSGINLSTEAYYTITKEIVAFANSHCGGRVVSTLEGGYNLNALSEAAARHVDALIEATG